MFNKLSGDQFDVQSHTVGGESLCGHANNTKVQELLTKKWDFVILQDFSEAPSVLAARNKTIECMRAFYRPALIKAGSNNVILYQTWGRRAGDPPIHFPDFMSMQIATIAGYDAYRAFLISSGSPLQVKIAPVGYTYRYINSHEAHPLDPSSLFYRLYIDDGSHPTPLGTYIGACSFYMRITGKSPVGLQYYPKGVTEAERDNLQKWVAQFK
jgi:hypothetical protein